MNFCEFGDKELYDLEKAPDELSNVYGDADHAEVLKLIEMVDKYNDDSVCPEKPHLWLDGHMKAK